MQQITFDFETYYDAEYSLRKMTPVEYILDARFETIGCAVKEANDKPFWLTHDELHRYLRGLPDDVLAISHNALFDMSIMAWRYNYHPKLMVDTLGMARAMLGHALRSLSLDSVAKHLGLGVKGGAVHKVQGMRLAAIMSAGFYQEYAEYSCNDADLCWGIYRALVERGFPVSEVAVMDTVLRAATRPKFVLRADDLHAHLKGVQRSKETLLDRCGLSSREDLMSNDRFAAALQRLGVEPPTKISLTTGKETFAFAKTDHAFMDLEEHENPEVQALVSARLGIKSTIEETRTERLLSISKLDWGAGNPQGLLPIPLRYSGAHTHRLSGDWKLNMQNLPRGGAIRKAIAAPPGYKVVACDASQIEARIAGWFCGADDLTGAFAAKQDVYSLFATSVFGYEVSKKTHPVERFIGKTAVLGLQYELGSQKFQGTVATQSKAQVGKEVILTDAESAKVVDTYRARYREIPHMWKTLNNLLPQMTGKLFSQRVGVVVFEHQSVVLPSGLRLHYHDLQYKDNGWWFSYGGKPKYVYGGKMLENIIQALARICVMDAAVRVRKRLGIDLALQVHDELVYVVPEKDAEAVLAIVHEEMCRRPVWGPTIPLDAEGDIADTYGDAK